MLGSVCWYNHSEFFFLETLVQIEKDCTCNNNIPCHDLILHCFDLLLVRTSDTLWFDFALLWRPVLNCPWIDSAMACFRNVVFESQQDLNHYILRIHMIGLALWQTFLCFDCTARDIIDLSFTAGLILGCPGRTNGPGHGVPKVKNQKRISDARRRRIQ